MQGIIIKGVGGLYEVKCGDATFTCSMRGKFRQKNYLSPIVGDRVEIEKVDDELCAINKIYERKNRLIRPSVSNIDTMVITFAAKSPNPDLLLVDKLTACAALKGIDVIICITKNDLKATKEYEEIYKKAGFPVISLGVDDKSGIEELKEMLKGKVSALAGASGVGKSTLINALGEGFLQETGKVSDKIKRGRHTTRSVELLELKSGGYVLDTPGFSSLEVPISDELSSCFGEIKKYSDCRFNDCKHMNEPDCGVKKALEDGKIAVSRYENYIKIYEEQKEREKYSK